MAQYYHFVGERRFFFVLTRLALFFSSPSSLLLFPSYQNFSHPPHISRVSLLSTRKSSVAFLSDNPSWFSILPQIRKLCPFITVIHRAGSSRISGTYQNYARIISRLPVLRRSLFLSTESKILFLSLLVTRVFINRRGEYSSEIFNFPSFQTFLYQRYPFRLFDYL